MFSLKKIFLLFLALTLGSASPYAVAQSQPEKTIQRAYFETEPMAVDGGTLQIEATAFPYQTEEDLEALKPLIRKVSNGTDNVAVYTLDATGNKKTPEIPLPILEGLGRSVPHVSTKVEPGAHSNRYNNTFVIMRLLFNGSAVFAGLTINLGAGIIPAASVALLLGGMSAAIQWQRKPVYHWIDQSSFLDVLAKKLKLIPDETSRTESSKNIERFRNGLLQTEKYGRWWLLEMGFLGIARLGMTLAGLPAEQGILKTSFKALGAQGTYELGVLRASEYAHENYPKLRNHIQLIKDVGFFAGSFFSTACSVANMVGLPFANIGYIALGATGVAFNVAKIVQKKIAKARAGRCRAVFTNQ